MKCIDAPHELLYPPERAACFRTKGVRRQGGEKFSCLLNEGCNRFLPLFPIDGSRLKRYSVFCGLSFLNHEIVTQRHGR